MDPHEKVNMDAEKIMSNTWDFEFMVKKTLKKLARTTEFHITPLGPSIYIYRYIDKFKSRFKKIIILAKFPNLFFWHAHAQTLAVLHCSWRLGWCCCYLRLLLLTAVVASVIAVAAAGVVVGAAGVAAAAAHALQ